jgi:hypothetical protein
MPIRTVHVPTSRPDVLYWRSDGRQPLAAGSMRSMIRGRGMVVALAGVSVLSLSACTSNDADAGDVVDAMTDARLPEDQAECMGREFEREFGDDQDVFNDIAAADDSDDWPAGTQETINSIIEECTGEPVPGAGGSESEGQDGQSDTTTTTATGDS